MSWVPVVSAESIAAVLGKDSSNIGYALHRSYTGSRIRAEGGEPTLLFPVDEIVAWAAVRLPGALTRSGADELNRRAIVVRGDAE